ncbi:complex I subunit 1 family protein [Mycobacterium intracellulare]|uniref:NADH-quinone oxidoreductase subunit H n=1 Tax=Mycobacterium intracellulare subsp. chimaera TaxID=222805 RepID=A0ABT7P8A7_MYCIT|nr:complex I subunit 1 family protein [Mycobacterium intracellulare]APD84121.1 NADH dehydrogenase [Mycobacterium intracellulare subsp. chimaera]ASL09452.1 respiratory-chain NADH dehydrogenase subunit 1 [Mycobacterium intracellulare subsp. chimaera]ASL21257.1 respiratory-chain NADH dehydrogenase subunit 1 [Mycobacterium intracellulare subsp. chimaera]ASQ86382.1 NADH-quinone oxidoreductase subunit H [Mycobacterium intracellulare subsp. chimaera]KPN44831.1 NADH dehydrogenase [Mycobacterium intrac
MADISITTVPGAWALAAGALVMGLALYAATLDGVLTARADGVRVGRASSAVVEVARRMRQRRRTTVAADSLLWRIGGAGLIVVASLMVTVVPLGRWTLFDLDVGVVWFNAMDVMVWALVWLAGWGANSAHSLVGGYRFLAHGLGYELPLMFALVAPAIAAESLRVADVVSAQHGLWYAVWMPVAFMMYCLGVVAFSVWGPFSPALGADIAGGVTAELSGVDRLVFHAGRYALLAAGAAFAVPMFLGGAAGPLLPGWLWVLVKTVALLSVFVWLRGRLPVLRPEKFMEIGWMVLLPLTLVQDLVVAVIAVRN